VVSKGEAVSSLSDEEAPAPGILLSAARVLNPQNKGRS
jgi:hypothetical protein